MEELEKQTMEEIQEEKGEGKSAFLFDKLQNSVQKMQPVWAKIKKILEGGLGEILLYLTVFLLSAVLFLYVKPHHTAYHKGALAQIVTLLLMTPFIVLIAYMGITKRLTARRLVFLLLCMGIVLRIGYMLYTPAATRQQDTFSKNHNGHEAYAWTIFTTGKLPTHNNYQFYHPPLNAFIQAGLMKIVSYFTGVFGCGEAFFQKYAYGKPSYIETERYFLYSTCMWLSVLYSVITCVTMLKILRLFNIPEKIKVAVAAILIFYPRQIQFAGMLNNDALAYMLGIFALYFALKWQKGNRAFGYILLCGLAVGLGMMAKLSSATICLPIAGIFIYEFVMTLRKKEGSMSLGKMIVQYGAFLCVCAPIGLWFQVYANLRFDQAFGHVFSNLNKKLYTGDHSWFSRFIFPFDMSEFFGSIYCRPFEGNYYLFNYALRSSIFGEFSYWQGEGFAVVSIFFAYLTAVLLFIALVWCAVTYYKGKKKGLQPFGEEKVISFKDLLFIFLLMQSQALSECYFYIQMPYGCTMDFRYIMPIILAMALTFGYTQKALVAQGGKGAIVLSRWLYIAAIGLLLSSAIFYCVCI